MSVWIAMPSIRPLDEITPLLERWKKLGYLMALYRPGTPLPVADLTVKQPDGFLGWGPSINMLANLIMQADASAEWIVAGNDDLWPVLEMDPRQIANELRSHYTSLHRNREPLVCGPEEAATFGVMQPTGDRGNNSVIDTAAASAWMGRSWCKYMYGATGPMCNDYKWFWADAELQEVAIIMGVYWQRADLTQTHQHWSRTHRHPPKHLIDGIRYYDTYRKVFDERKAAGFPGFEPMWREDPFTQKRDLTPMGNQ